MTKATNLVNRVVEEFRSRGIKILDEVVPGAGYYTKNECIEGSKMLSIKEVYKHNGTEENVTAVITVYTVGGYQCRSLKPISKVKVPKMASDKVIKNRVDKAMEFYI